MEFKIIFALAEFSSHHQFLLWTIFVLLSAIGFLNAFKLWIRTRVKTYEGYTGWQKVVVRIVNHTVTTADIVGYTSIKLAMPILAIIVLGIMYNNPMGGNH